MAKIEDNVLDGFDNYIDKIIEDCGGDCRKALVKSLALNSGHDDHAFEDRSLQYGHTGQLTY